MTERRRRGRCPVCGFRFPLLIDGITLQSHKLYGAGFSDLRAFYCAGGGQHAVDSGPRPDRGLHVG